MMIETLDEVLTSDEVVLRTMLPVDVCERSSRVGVAVRLPPWFVRAPEADDGEAGLWRGAREQN